MEHLGFRKKKEFAESSPNIDILLKQLEIAHKIESQFGKYIMLTKGWAVTLFTAIIIAYFQYVLSLRTSKMFFLIIIPFVSLWCIDALMGAYQTPYYDAIIQIEDELAGRERERKFIPLTYEKEKATEIVWKNFRECLFHKSVWLFYLPLIIVLVLLLFWSLCFYPSNSVAFMNNANCQEWTFTAAAAAWSGVIVSLAVFYMIRRQVKAQELNNKKSVVPFLAITLERDVQGNRVSFANTLIVYIRNNIALDIEWVIYKNKDPTHIVDRDNTPGAVPYLRDELLPIKEIPIEEHTQGSNKNNKVTFEAKITYKSILKDEYEVNYSLSVWYDSDNQLMKEEKLISWEFPWD